MKPFALSLSKSECGSTSSPRTVSFYCVVAIAKIIRELILPKLGYAFLATQQYVSTTIHYNYRFITAGYGQPSL